MALTWLILACSAGGPDEPADGWAVARAALTGNPRNCPYARGAYCITDPDFVDPILREVLDGPMPQTRRAAERVAARVLGPYRSRQTATPDARARVEARIRAWYDHPIPEQVGDVVTVDLGVAPGPLEPAHRGGWAIRTSDVWTEGAWTEAGPRLRELAVAHPAARRVRVSLEVPEPAGGTTRWVYTLEPSTGRVLVQDGRHPNEVWFGPAPVEGPLSTHDLTHCAVQWAAEHGQTCPE